MAGRRIFTKAVVLSATAFAFLGAGQAQAASPSKYVNPFMGTLSGAPDFGTGGGAGNTYPGATAPFGLLNWSPDTMPGLDNFAGGYTYTDPLIRGFSLTHISGAGCSGYQDFPFIPTAADITRAPSDVGTSNLHDDLYATYSHDQESATPGSYSVKLNPGQPNAIDVDLAATTRAGTAKFTFPDDRPANIMVSAAGNGMANPLMSVQIDPKKGEISGVSETGSFCYGRPYSKIYMVADFGRKVVDYGTWTDDQLSPGSTSASDTAVDPFKLMPLTGINPPPSNPSSTAQAGAYLGFGTGGQVTARVGISFTSVADARRNLGAEVGNAGVGQIAKATRGEWDKALGRVAVRGGSRESKQLMYTSLYHAMVEPRTWDDVDGSYAKMGGGGIAQVKNGHRYADFSGWDTYRTQVPLMGMLFPDRAADLGASLLDFAKGGGCLPKWSFANGHTMVMTGDPADQAISTLSRPGRRSPPFPASAQEAPRVGA